MAAAQRRPNFVVFLTDDQGYGDLSCMGATDFCTPHLDALAASGARFTNWYSNSPVCSPSRAALLTGRYPGNAGVRQILAGHRTATGLPAHVPTIAEALRKLGYQTGMFGKWHLGLSEGSRPENHGFDEWMGFMAGCIDYYSHVFYWGAMSGKTDPMHDLWENGKEIWRNGEYFTEMVSARAVEFIRSATAATRDEKPFFLYVPYNAPHYPMHAPRNYIDRFRHLPSDRRIMAAMLAAVDDGVGEIVTELERQGVRENTCILFMSDNGPSRETRNWMDGRRDTYYGGTAGMLKGHKFGLFEGGVRVPGIWSWPATIAAKQVIDEPAAAMDVLPTLLRAAGGDPGEYEIDGRDITGMLTRGEKSPHHRIFWEMGKQTAVRQGDWKLTLNGRLIEGGDEQDAVFLANLKDDMGERHNRAAERPDLAAELRAAAESWREGIEQRWEREFAPRGT